jgi:hypothetical protein
LQPHLRGWGIALAQLIWIYVSKVLQDIWLIDKNISLKLG